MLVRESKTKKRDYKEVFWSIWQKRGLHDDMIEKKWQERETKQSEKKKTSRQKAKELVDAGYQINPHRGR